jgi:hypothetical protein
VISIEHDKEWIKTWDRQFESTYIYAPLKEFKPIKNYDGNIWYDAEVLKSELPGFQWDLLLIDGPPSERCGLVKYWEMLFDRGVPVIFDDVNRVGDWKVMRGISARLKRPYTVYEAWESKHFGVILP